MKTITIVLFGLFGLLMETTINGFDITEIKDGVSADSLKSKTGEMKKMENENKKGVVKSKQEWQQCLSPEQFRVLREKGTERAYTGKYYEHYEEGTYVCAACGNPLFSSDTKFDSGTGWPSFYKPAEDSSVAEHDDNSMFMKRTEITCNNCGSHLGHVFDDGPNPTGLRYCINSVSLDFVKKGDEKKVQHTMKPLEKK